MSDIVVYRNNYITVYCNDQRVKFLKIQSKNSVVRFVSLSQVIKTRGQSTLSIAVILDVI